MGTVRLRESSPGVYRLDHDSGRHDDRAVSLGLAALALTERPEAGYAAISSAAGVRISDYRRGPLPPGAALSNPYAQSVAGRGVLASVAAAQRAQTPAQRRHGVGLAVAGSANDPNRR